MLGEAKILGEAKMFDFWRITLFSLEKRPSNHKTTKCFKNLGGHGPIASLATPMLNMHLEYV